MKGLILVTPYDSLVRVVQSRLPWVPAGLILRNRFDSVAIAHRLNLPLLALIAERDEVIPPAHAYNLLHYWGGPAVQVTIPNAGHNDLQENDLYWDSIAHFLTALE